MQYLPKRLLGRDVFLLLVFACSFIPFFRSVSCGHHDVDVEAYVEAFRSIDAAEDRTTGQKRAVLIQPPWRTDVIEALERNFPEHTFRSDLSNPSTDAFPDMWVLSDAAYRRPARWPLEPHTSIRGVEISRFSSTSKPSSERSLARRLLSNAQVSIVGADKPSVKCDWNKKAKRHQCPGAPDWIWVGEKTIQSAGKKQTCIWAHPVKNGTLRVQFPGKGLPKALRLTGLFQDSAVRHQTGADVTIRVEQNGKQLGVFRNKNIAGPQQFSFEASAFQTNGGPLRLDISTEDDAVRHFCFDMDETS